jgi:hypothetical protein
MIFIKNKYYNWYYNIITNAKSQPRVKSKTQYYEKHHILPKSLKGDNTKENLVLLTAREHFICHYLLCKMLPINTENWYSMVRAFNMMKTTVNNHRYFNSHLYEYARKNMSKTMQQFTGSKNPRYGMCWVTHSWIINLQKQVPKTLIEEYIGQGWYGPKNGYQPKLSLEEKKLKLTICPFCGTRHKSKTLCQICKIDMSKQALPGLNKYFNLNLANLGTPNFITDWELCKNYAKNLYNKYSSIELSRLVNHKNTGGLHKLLRLLNISIRTPKESREFLKQQNPNYISPTTRKPNPQFLYKIQLPDKSIITTNNMREFLKNHNIFTKISYDKLAIKGYIILSKQKIIK